MQCRLQCPPMGKVPVAITSPVRLLARLQGSQLGAVRWECLEHGERGIAAAPMPVPSAWQEVRR
jgi:hypothetical protein